MLKIFPCGVKSTPQRTGSASGCDLVLFLKRKGLNFQFHAKRMSRIFSSDREIPLIFTAICL